MTTVTVELKHVNAKRLLKELEEMNIIKLIDEPCENSKVVKPSQLRGFLSKEKANALLSHVAEARNEWDKNFLIK